MMCKHVLVAFASQFGSTAEVAEAVGMCLEQIGTFAEVVPVNQVQSLERYDAVVVGSAIRGGMWLPDAVRFLETHREALGLVPVAYFSVCMTLREDTPEDRRVVAAYHDPLLRLYPHIHPVSIGMFAGALEQQRLPPLTRLMSSVVDFPEGDYRNWSLVRKWAQSVFPELVGDLFPL